MTARGGLIAVALIAIVFVLATAPEVIGLTVILLVAFTIWRTLRPFRRTGVRR